MEQAKSEADDYQRVGTHTDPSITYAPSHDNARAKHTTDALPHARTIKHRGWPTVRARSLSVQSREGAW
jgi:hypothetical protein